MKKIVSILILLAVSFASCKKDEDKQDKNPKMSEIISDSLGVIREDLGDQLGKLIPSLSVYIQTPDETIFATNAQEDEPVVTAGTYFRFASNSKNFTATAILNMYEDGWLDIYDFITDTIPGSNTTYVPSEDNWNIPYKNQISIEQLLQHSAGVYDVDNDPVPGCDGMSYTEYTMDQNPDHQFSSGELVGQLAKHDLSYWEPGFSHHYSNTGYTILSEIIARVYSENIAGQKNFKDYLYDYIYGPGTKVPLDVHFPFLASDQNLPDPHITGTIYFPEDLGGTITYDATNMSAHVAEGNGYGNFTELNKYVRSLMTGSNVLDPATITLMQTDYSPDTAGHTTYALGCFHITNMGFGHNGFIRGYLSVMVYDPQYDVSVVAMMNAVDWRNNEVYVESIKGLYTGAWKAREMLGYPGVPWK